MTYIWIFIKEMAIFFNDMAIYLIIGFGFAGLLHIFFPENLINKHLGKSNFWSVIKSSLFGIPIPICSCGVIPVAASLRKKGASKGATLSFLISTPQIGADSFMITYSLIGWIFGIFRIVAAFVTAMFAGIATNLFVKDEEDLQEMTSTKVADTTMTNRAKSVMHYIQYELFGAIATHMMLGIIVAGLITVFIPKSFFELYLSNQFLSMIVMLVIGIPMYVCATSSTPIAASLILKGMSPGAALVFLLAGPATNAITISTVSKSLGKKVAFIYLASISVVSVLLGYGLNLLVSQDKIQIMNHMSHEMLPMWIKYTGSAILLAMFLIHYVQNFLNKRKFNKELDNSKAIGIKVEGMTCNHCKASVIKAVESVDGTKNINVNLDEGKVYFEFESLNFDDVKKAITDKGFNVKDQKTAQLIVDGMTCNHCKANVAKTIDAFEGTSSININLGTKQVRFEYEKEDLNEIKKAIVNSGFEVVE